jgi:hypothetical protein
LKCSKAIASSFTLEAAAIISLAVAAIYWIDSVYLFIVITIDSAYGQTVSLPPSSQPVTPFKKWYDEQKEKVQLGNAIGVNITSPTKGQQVASGQHLAVSGASTDNSTSDCKVSVIVNGIRPYQPAAANGTGGINDYSTWNFMISPTYTTIKEGLNNKITSKLECTPNLTKWYSVNVTGIATTTESTEIEEEEQEMPSSVATSSNGKALLISLDIDKNPIALGENQTIEATVHDAITDEQIENAIVELNVTDDISAGDIIEEFSDQDGDISYTWELEEDNADEPGTYIATVQASADGYQSSSKTATFEVIEENEVQQDEDNEGEDEEPPPEDEESGDEESGDEESGDEEFGE